MKIAIVGDSPRIASGFGVQTDLISRGLNKLGHEVCILGGMPPRENLPSGITDIVVDTRNLDAIDTAIYRLDPDACIMFSSTYMVSTYGRCRAPQAICPTFYWLPWEAHTLPHDANSFFLNSPSFSVVHLSEYARSLWIKHFPQTKVIPHCVDTDVFYKRSYAEEDKKLLRRKWSRKLRYPFYDDTFLIINSDRNICHKRWDATLSYFSSVLKNTTKDVCLIINTKKVEGKWQENLYGFDIPKMAKLYGVEDNIVYTDFDWVTALSREDLAELYSICDLRVTMSEGEGFGCLAIEFGALGVPQIFNQCEPLEELTLGIGGFKPVFYEYQRDALWAIPDVKSMVQETLAYIDGKKPQDLNVLSEHVRNNFSVEVVCNKWNDLLNGKKCINKKNHWALHKWGHTAKTLNLLSFRDLVVTIKKINPHSRVLEIGSGTGETINFCLEAGLNCLGLEVDNLAFSNCSPIVQKSCQEVPDFLDFSKYADYDVLIATDFFDRICNHFCRDYSDQVFVEKILASNPKWLFLRFQPSYYPGGKVHNFDTYRDLLQKEQYYRRLDLEAVIKNDYGKNFNHEIYTKSQEFPPALGLVK